MQGKVDAWIGRYLAHLRTERRLSPHTEAAYRRDLEALVAYCDGEKVSGWKQLDNFHVRTFAAREHRDGLGPRSVQRRLSALRGFFNYLIREKVIDSNPAADIRAHRLRGDISRRAMQPAGKHFAAGQLGSIFCERNEHGLGDILRQMRITNHAHSSRVDKIDMALH